MVYRIVKEYHGHGYRVENKETGKVHAHNTTKEKAENQVRLLNAIEHGYTIKKRNQKNLRNIKYK